VQELAVDAVKQVIRDVGDSKREVEIKKYAKVEKSAGGDMQVLYALCIICIGTPVFGIDYLNPAIASFIASVTSNDRPKSQSHVHRIKNNAQNMQDSCVINGVMFAKDVVSPDRMQRKLIRPRILLLDCPLEFKKGENQTAVELANDEDFAKLLQQEEQVLSGIPYSLNVS
jgi:chaperonin GroEL (HSP60 family)